jgi:hypothetical protein
LDGKISSPRVGVEADERANGSATPGNRARTHASVADSQTAGRDPGIHLCQDWHEIHRNDPGVTAGCAMRLSMLPKKRKQMKSASKLAQWQIRVDKIAEFSEGSREDAVK